MNQRQRSEMGCAAMLLSAILLVGVFALANTSRDNNTTGNNFWTAVLLIAAVVMLVVGSIVWLRNRNPNTQEDT